jgi:hypothetical protein
MKVHELFAALSYGELNTLKIGMSGAGTIDATAQDRLVYYANQALMMLYNRFSHNRDYVKFEQKSGILRYYLRSTYAVSDTDGGNLNPRYILDDALAPFAGNLVRILTIRNEAAEDPGEREYQINDTGSARGVQLLSYDTLYFAEVVEGTVLDVAFQCSHPTLTIPVDLDEEIFLAPILREALISKIAAKVYGSIGGEDSTLRMQFLEQQYESICVMAESQDMLSETFSQTHSKLYNGGWR